MRNSSSTSSAGTAKPTLAAPPSIQLRPPTPSDTARPSDSSTETSGRALTPPCIDDPTEDTDTSDECEFEFTLAFGRKHPVAVHCTVHGWNASVLDED